MEFYAKSGIVVFALLLVFGFLLGRRRGDHRAVAVAIWAAGAPLVALVIGQTIGRFVDRARPYETLDNVHLLLSRTADFSFPSDHATVAGAVAAGLFLLDRRLGIVTAFAALLMAFARVYVGAHYPGDVLAGLVLGSVVASIGCYFPIPLLERGVDLLSGWSVGRRLIGDS